MSAPDDHYAVQLIEALHAIWAAIRHRHPDVPPVVLIPAPAPRGQSNVLGHFAPIRWTSRTQEGERYHEVVVVAEHLNRTAADICETLLHEAVHARNCERGIFDCSASQYHNRHFRDAAVELGLEVTQVRHYGFALTSLPPITQARYQAEIDALSSVLIHRRAPRMLRGASGPSGGATPVGGAPAKRDARMKKATCACGFIIRVSRKTLAATRIRCEVCQGLFQPAG